MESTRYWAVIANKRGAYPGCRLVGYHYLPTEKEDINGGIVHRYGYGDPVKFYADARKRFKGCKTFLLTGRLAPWWRIEDIRRINE